MNGNLWSGGRPRPPISRDRPAAEAAAAPQAVILSRVRRRRISKLQVFAF